MKTDTVTIDRRYFEALVTAAELGRQVLCASIESTIESQGCGSASTSAQLIALEGMVTGGR
jgi:hypothetical protein